MKSDPQLHQKLTSTIDIDWSDSDNRRELGDRDLIFARKTQWDDDLDCNVDTEYRGQFDIVKPERRRILSELMRNEFSNKYRADSEESEDLAEILEGYYRKMTRTNTAKVAAEIAITEALDCGMGAWRLEVVDENDTDPLNTNKKVQRSVIHEANNKVIWDANSKIIDKSDAKRCTIITAYTLTAWGELMEEYGLSKTESDFPIPEYMNSSVLCWDTKQTKTLAEHYEIKESFKKMTIMSDGDDAVALTNSELRKQADALKMMGYEKVNTKKVKKRTVWKTILTGAHILEREKIAGKYIPVMTLFGEWGFIGGAEYYEGIVRILRDPQQLKNTMMSYVFDMMAKGPIEKDIYFQEQIDGYEVMYEEQNNYKAAYYLQNRLAPDGTELPPGPVGKKGGPQVPQAAQYLLEKSDQAVQQSTGGGITPEQMINPQVTEDQLQFIKARLDQQTQLYQEHLEYTYRYEGVVVASILSEIIDNERELSIMSADGSESRVKVNEVGVDYKTESLTVKNDMSKADMEVFTDVGLSFATQKEKVRTEMREMIANPVSPEDVQMASWIYAMNLEGAEYKPMRDKARKNMLLAGYIDEKDQTDEEKQELAMAQQQQAQQGQEPDAMTLAAQAEIKKAEAMQVDAQANMIDKEIDRFNAETNRMKVMLEAQKLGLSAQDIEAKVRNTNADTAKKISDIENSNVNTALSVQQAMVQPV